MNLIVTLDHNPNKHHSICVPAGINRARIEILRSRGAPVYIGTELAILHTQEGALVLSSKMSGVVNRVCVDDNQMVNNHQELFELRNTNVHRDKNGNKMEPAPRLTNNTGFLLLPPKPKNYQRKNKWKPSIWQIQDFPQTAILTNGLQPSHQKGLYGQMLKMVD